MAATLETPVVSSITDDDMTDEQIEQLLAAAAARLQEKSKKGSQLVKTPEEQRLTFPKLDTGNLEKPYVSMNGEIATLDASRLLQDRHRKLANGARKVEDPVVAKKAAQEVCFTSSHKPTWL
jgi:hypothetical protein